MVLRFRIQLRDVKPAIWRRIDVPDWYTFWDLHVAIQDAMGWQDYHLHEFVLEGPEGSKPVRIGIPDGEGWEGDPLDGGRENILDYFVSGRYGSALYLYDFGDGWEHDVVLEEFETASSGVAFPRCLDGARACPPEDCGGPWGYEAILSGSREDAAEFKDYHPESFDSTRVVFADPEERWLVAFGETPERKGASDNA